MFQIDLDGLSPNCCICSCGFTLYCKGQRLRGLHPNTFGWSKQMLWTASFLSFLNVARCRFTGSFFFIGMIDMVKVKIGGCYPWIIFVCNFKDQYKQLKPRKAEPLASQSVLASLEGNTEFGCSQLSCKSICKKCDTHTHWKSVILLFNYC